LLSLFAKYAAVVRDTAAAGQTDATAQPHQPGNG